MPGARPELRRALLVLFITLLVILAIIDLFRAESFLRSLFTFSEPPGQRIQRTLERLRRTR